MDQGRGQGHALAQGVTVGQVIPLKIKLTGEACFKGIEKLVLIAKYRCPTVHSFLVEVPLLHVRGQPPPAQHVAGRQPGQQLACLIIIIISIIIIIIIIITDQSDQ